MGHVDCGFSGGFALLVVLFILLIIVGAVCFANMNNNARGNLLVVYCSYFYDTLICITVR